MKRRLFTDSYFEPTDYLLEKHLGNAMRFYRAIMAISGGYRRQWQFNYGNGWILRVHDTRKALYYLIAFDEGIEVSLTVRDSEREGFLKSIELEKLYPQFLSGTKYPEGYALRFEIENDVACSSVSHFLMQLMKTRIPFTRSFPLKRTKKNAESNLKHKVSVSSKLVRRVPTSESHLH